MAVQWPAVYDPVFSRLLGVEGYGNGRWMARCPAHEDEKPSLSLAIGDGGKLLLRCHKRPEGCATSVVLQAMGLQFGDLYADKKTPGGSNMGRFVCSYRYCDEAGKVLFDVLRWDPKSFSQRKPNPNYNPREPADRDKNPEFIYTMEGVRRVIYRLAEVTRALKKSPHRWVFIVEGERDVDLAWKHGICATTNPMGAGKWLPEYSKLLTGCNVAVIPDNDEVGKKHAEQVAASCQGTALSVRIVHLPELPEKGDFTDWWIKRMGVVNDAEAVKLELANLAKNTPVWSPAAEPALAAFTGQSQNGAAAPATPATETKQAEPSKPAGETVVAEAATERLLRLEAEAEEVGRRAEALLKSGTGMFRSAAEAYGFARLLWVDFENAVSSKKDPVDSGRDLAAAMLLVLASVKQ